MIALALRRFIISIPVLFIVLTLTFLLVRLAPGNPFSGERHMSAEVMETLQKEYQLNGTLLQQYLAYLGNVLHGNLGISTQYRNRTINEMIAQTLPVSMLLGSIAFSFALVCGLGLGAFAALRQGAVGDRLAMGTALVGISIPNFVLAPLLIILIAIELNFLPVAGWGSWDQVILPAFCLSVPFTATIARLTRNSFLEVLRLDFIRTARAKGVSESGVIFRHALKVAILPLISYSGPAAAGILTGSIVIETIFGIPGIGPFFVNSITNRDPFMTCGVVLIFSTFLILFNLIADILYSLIDRRVKIS